MIEGLKTLVFQLNRATVAVGGVFLLAMVGITCANIVFRQIWLPIQGTFELMGFFGAAVTAFALGYTQARKGHIAVDVLVNTFPVRVRTWVQAVNNLACALFFSLVAWKIADKAATVRSTGELTETLRMGYHPFVYGVAAGFALLGLVMVVDWIAAVFGGSREARR